MTREEQIQYIKENFLDKPVKTIARELGKSHTFVSLAIKREGLVIPQEIILKRKENSRFSKNHTPFNKGKRQVEYISAEKIEACKKTQFISGQNPHNLKYDGHIAIRESKGLRYAWIRLNKGKYVLLHRYVYESVYGKISSGTNIQFRDGNTLNCHPENLYLISRKDQVRINKAGGKNIPVELHKTILLVQDLNKKINEKQN